MSKSSGQHIGDIGYGVLQTLTGIFGTFANAQAGEQHAINNAPITPLPIIVAAAAATGKEKLFNADKVTEALGANYRTIAATGAVQGVANSETETKQITDGLNNIVSGMGGLAYNTYTGITGLFTTNGNEEEKESKETEELVEGWMLSELGISVDVEQGTTSDIIPLERLQMTHEGAKIESHDIMVIGEESNL